MRVLLYFTLFYFTLRARFEIDGFGADFFLIWFCF